MFESIENVISKFAAEQYICDRRIATIRVPSESFAQTNFSRRSGGGR